MSNAVTSYESWTGGDANNTFCWNCNVGRYLVYTSDITQTSRCGSCGELEQDSPQAKLAATSTAKADADPAKVVTPKTRPAAKRAAAKPKDKV